MSLINNDRLMFGQNLHAFESVNPSRACSDDYQPRRGYAAISLSHSSTSRQRTRHSAALSIP